MAFARLSSSHNGRVHLYVALGLAMASLDISAATWVQEIVGSPDDFRISRGGVVVPVGIYRELQPGDEVRVLKEPCTLRLKRDDGTEIAVEAGNSPYRVAAYGSPPGVITSLISWAGEWLTTQIGAAERRPTVRVFIRGPHAKPISIPMVPRDRSRLLRGRRQLYLAWTGGAPPFRVRLSKAGSGDAILDQTNIQPPDEDVWRYHTELLDLAPGSYWLEIVDARRGRAVSVRVVPDAKILTTPEVTGVSDPQLMDTVRATLLATQGDEWLLEAYQQAMVPGIDYAPALILRRRLELGAHPQREGIGDD